MLQREYPSSPIACAATIIMNGDSVLLIQRGREPNYGRWSFPGGKVELGETSGECAARETREETGLEVEILDVVTVVNCIFHDEAGRVRYHYIITDYLAKPVSEDLCAATDVLQAAWIPFEVVMKYDLAPPTGDVLEKAILQWRNQ